MIKQSEWLFLIAVVGLTASSSVTAKGLAEGSTDSVVGRNCSSQLCLGPDMDGARAAHTATTLPDGRVLIAGGMSKQAPTTGAQVYLPDTGQFSALHSMVMDRQSQSATLLQNGQVLLVGGYGADNAITTTAELFDPASNRFLPTGSLNSPRAGHVAVLLENGLVLMVGGVGPGWNYLSSAELYDPSQGIFTPTGSMATARESHTAVLLQDGRVLVSGGHHGRRADIQIHSSAEIYDPGLGVFQPSGSLNIRRHKHDAILLPDGQVLVSGGADERDDDGVYDSTELFDPQSKTFTSGPTMNLGRYKHAGTSLLLANGTVLLAGGAPQAEIYDPQHRSFSLVEGDPRMAGQFSAAALLPGGGALVSGGYGNGTGPRSSSWIYHMKGVGPAQSLAEQ